MICIKMIYLLLFVIFGHYSSANARTLHRSTRGIDDGFDCKELNKTDWSIDRLKNLTLDTWPWKCLDSHYDNNTLRSVIKNSCINVFDAAGKGYIGFVQFYAEREAVNLNSLNEDGETPLHLAVKNGHLNVVKYIVEKMGPTSLEIYDKNVRTPLQAVAFYGQIDIMKYLIEDAKRGIRYRRRTLFREAAEGGQLLMLKYLMDDQGFTLDQTDGQLVAASGTGGNVDLLKYLIYEKNLTRTGSKRRSENTALHEAALAGHLEMVRFLVETLNYKLDLRNDENNTAAHLAAEKGNLPVLKYLVDEKGFDLNLTNEYDEYLIHVAAHAGQLDVVRYLVEQKGVSVELLDLFLRTPLHVAVRGNQFEVVKYLIEEKKADINKKDFLGLNLLHEAAHGIGTLKLFKYLIDDQKMGKQINEVDNMNCTVLRLLVQFNNIEIIKFLVGERNGDTKILDFLGDDLLHTAARLNKFEIVKYLVEERGHNVNLTNPSGSTAYDLAPNLEIRKYLLQRMDIASMLF